MLIDSLNLDETIRHYYPLIKNIAKSVLNKIPKNMNIDIDDLYSAGSTGLIDAFQKFDSTKSCSFKTYAAHRIEGSILDEIRNQSFAPRSILEKRKSLNKTINYLQVTLGRVPNSMDIISYMNIEPDTYHSLVEESQVLIPVSTSNLRKTETSDKNQFDQLYQKKIKDRISQAIQLLKKRDQLLMSLYYEEEMNFKEIGKVLSLTESRVCQLHSAILLKLRPRLITDVFEAA